jgi:protease I
MDESTLYDFSDARREGYKTRRHNFSPQEHSTMSEMTKAADYYLSLLGAEASPLVPRISTPLLLAENTELRELLTKAATDRHAYAGKCVAVLATDGVEEIELTATLRYFRERGATVELLAPAKPEYPAKYGVQMPAIRDSHILTIRYMDFGGWIAFDRRIEDAKAADYDAAIVPGGAWNPDVLRADRHALALLKEIAKAGKPTAAICHGPWVLMDAGLLRGRRATCWWSMQNDLTGAGATFIDEPAVIDGNIVTSRSPGDLPAFLSAVGARLKNGS